MKSERKVSQEPAKRENYTTPRLATFGKVGLITTSQKSAGAVADLTKFS